MKKQSLLGPVTATWPLATTLVLATVARVVQLAAGSSLHLDEAALARNVVDRDLRALIGQPLDYDQVAPAAFLALQKASTLIFGRSDWVLRLVPFVAAMALIPVFLYLARRFLKGGPLVASCAIFAVAYSFVSHAATAKQYSSDMLAATALVALALFCAERGFTTRPSVGVALAGAPLILVSFPAAPIAVTLGVWLTLAWWRRTGVPSKAGLLTVLASWGAAAGAAAGLALAGVSPETRDYMQEFWQSGFVPWRGSAADLLLWLPQQTQSVFDILLFPRAPSHWLESALLWFALALCGLGAFSLLRRHRMEALALLAPLAAAIGLAAAHRLPFADRAGLYTAPILALLVAEGAASLGRLGPKAGSGRRAGFAALAVAFASILPVVLHPFPWSSQQIRPVLTQVAEEAERSGATVYAFYAAGQAVSWYAPKVGLSEWVQGGCHRGEVRGYLRELDSFRGGAVWVVFTHVRGVFDEVDPMLAYLRTVGRETARIDDPDGNEAEAAAFAYRFDLTDPTRLAKTTAETFDTFGSFAGSPAAACTGPAARHQPGPTARH